MNLGKHIQEVMRSQGMSASELAKLIPCERTNVYNIFKRKSLDARLLMRISKVLNYDFFIELSDMAFPKNK
jgi:transcriptional regulator with XRE-family HTH domain